MRGTLGFALNVKLTLRTALALAILPLLGWWLTGLFDLDEGFYGAVAAEMNRRHEWITPFYNGHPWFEKPILVYWLVKPSLLLFGDMVGPRLPSVLCTFGSYAMVGWFASKRFAPAVAPLAVLVLGSSLLFLGVGRMLMTDPPLVLCLTGAFLAFWESLAGNPRWRIVFGFLIGASVLAKGPVGVLLAIPILGWTYWRQPELRPRFRGYWTITSVVFCLVVASWYVPAYLIDGQLFVQKFLVEQNLQRFTGGDKAHTLGGFQSLTLFIPVFLLGMAPWSWWAIKSLKQGDPLRRYLACWAVVVFVFFSISGAKLVHYILPLFPPMALLVADKIQGFKWAPKLAVAMTLGMAVLATTVFNVYYPSSGQAEARRKILMAKDRKIPVVLYQLSRRQKRLGTGGTTIQETSLPSLLLYLDSTALDTDDWATVLAQPRPFTIFTRPGRIDWSAVEGDLRERGIRMQEENKGAEHYVLVNVRDAVSGQLTP